MMADMMKGALVGLGCVLACFLIFGAVYVSSPPSPSSSPTTTWEEIDAPYRGSLCRQAVPEGWIVWRSSGGITYVPDVAHVWSGK